MPRAGSVRHAGAGTIDYSQTVELDLATVVASLAGPKRPQDRIELPKMKASFDTLFSKPVAENGFAQSPDKLARRYPVQARGRAASRARTTPSSDCRTTASRATWSRWSTTGRRRIRSACTGPKPLDIGNGDVLIAAITSCTNTSNPGVLLAAGLLAKKAAAKGLTVKRHIKTSLAPGSRVVTEYLTKSGLLPELEKLNFYLAGYGCTTCIGNSGPLDPSIEEVITKNDLVCAAVLSGNRNFEARIHPNIKANFLASPPLVVAYAIAGRANIDLTTEPLGTGSDGNPVFLRDVWPTSQEIGAVMQYATDPATYRRLYGDFTKDNPLWNAIPTTNGAGLRLGQVDLHRRAAVLRRLQDAAGQGRRGARRARARHLRRLGDDRPHQPGGIDQADLAGRHLSARARRRRARLQQLRQPARQPRGDDARHVRQRAHQESDAAAARPTARASRAAKPSCNPKASRWRSTTRR